MAKRLTQQPGPRLQGLIQHYQQELQARHDAQRTIDTYEHWLRPIPALSQALHPREMGSKETRPVLDRLVGVEALVAGVLYGGGLRLMEALRLRVRDVDVQRRQITVRQGKGGKDRRTMLPTKVGEKLRAHLVEVRRVHRQDLAEGYGRVRLPHALARRYPHAPVEWGRHHLDPTLIQKAVRRAVLASVIITPAWNACRTSAQFKSSWATKTSTPQ